MELNSQFKKKSHVLLTFIIFVSQPTKVEDSVKSQLLHFIFNYLRMLGQITALLELCAWRQDHSTPARQGLPFIVNCGHILIWTSWTLIRTSPSIKEQNPKNRLTRFNLHEYIKSFLNGPKERKYECPDHWLNTDTVSTVSNSQLWFTLVEW